MSAVANRFVLRCEPKRLMLLYYKICPCFLEENLLSDLSGVKTGRSRDLCGPKDVSYLVDDPPGKAASKIRHDHPDLEGSDNKFFSRNDSTMSKAR